MAPNDNAWLRWRAAFAADPAAVALTLVDADSADREQPRLLHYRWDDLDRGSAMLANLLASLALPPDARVTAVGVDACAEALMLQWGVLRAGHVWLALPDRVDGGGDAPLDAGDGVAPAVVVCPARDFARLSRRAFAAGTQQVYTLNADRRGTLLDRAAPQRDAHDVVLRRADDPAIVVARTGAGAATLSHGELVAAMSATHAVAMPTVLAAGAPTACDAAMTVAPAAATPARQVAAMPIAQAEAVPTAQAAALSRRESTALHALSLSPVIEAGLRARGAGGAGGAGAAR